MTLYDSSATNLLPRAKNREAGAEHRFRDDETRLIHHELAADLCAYFGRYALSLIRIRPVRLPVCRQM